MFFVTVCKLSSGESDLFLLLTAKFVFRILLESDPTIVVQRAAIKQDDIPLGEQTVSQVRYVCVWLYYMCIITAACCSLWHCFTVTAIFAGCTGI